MEKRTVRIYKAPDGKGKYINKTNQFLNKAQQGTEVNEGPEKYIQYIQSELQKQTSPEEIYKTLVQAGIPEESAQGLIQHVMQGMSQGTPAEDQQVAESNMQYQPDMSTQFQDGGEQVFNQYAEMQDQDNSENLDLQQMIENTPGTQDIKFPGMENYIPSYEPIGWNETNTDAYGNFVFESGGTKKSFTKNVLTFLKEKQEGGEDKTLGKGNPMDTSLDTVARRKSDFLATLKSSADKAKTEELYGKMMESGDPSMMQIANTLGQGDNAQPIPLAPIMQMGGFTGGVDPMEYFQNGGYDAQYAQDGVEVRKAKINYIPRIKTVPGGLRNITPWNKLYSSYNQISQNIPYNVSDNTAYTGSMEGFHPIERKVTKTGLFGRPKQWTDIYTNAPQRIELDKETKASNKSKKSKDWVDITGPKNKYAGLSNEEWDTLSASAKKAIRKGNRALERNERRYNKQLEKDREFEAFGKGNPSVNYMFDNEEDYNRDWEGLELDKDKNIIPYKLKGDVYQTADTPGYKQLYKSAGAQYNPIDFNNDPSLDWDTSKTKYYREGGLYKAILGVKTPTNELSPSSDATRSVQLLTDPNNSLMGVTQPFMNQNVPQNNAPQQPVYYTDPNMTGENSESAYDTIAVDSTKNKKRTFDGEAAVNVFNAGAEGVLGFINRRQQARQEKEFMNNNFNADNIYAHSSDKDRGDWVDYGSQLGQYRFDQMGQRANGRFAYGQTGGFMQEGGPLEGEETFMTEEELADFLANGGEVEYL